MDKKEQKLVKDLEFKLVVLRTQVEALAKIVLDLHRDCFKMERWAYAWKQLAKYWKKKALTR